MAGKQTNWLLGCGIGCAVVLLVLLGLGFLGGRFVNRTQAGFDAAIETRGSLEERFGAADSFVPTADGSVSPERMEAFLAAREATMEARQLLADSWSEIPMNPAAARELESQGLSEKMRSVFEITRSSVGLGATMGRFYEARNQAMSEADIGFGEYSYIYALAYYSWLGHVPDEGPETAGQGDSAEGEEEEVFGPRMGEVFSARARRDLREILRNQLESLPESADDEWRQILAEEVEALESRSGGFPWRGELPSQIAGSFEPYRERLETTYNSVTNPFELGRNVRRGRFSVGME